MLLSAFGKAPWLQWLPGKTGRVMKLITLFLFAACLQLAAKTEAQGITISLNKAALTTVFAEIQQQTGYRFIYATEQLANVTRITLAVQNSSLADVLEICFRDQPLTYSIDGKFIIVKTREKKNSPPADNDDLRGKVRNEKDLPIAGVSVTIKGKNTGTATNEKGEFFLAGVPSGSTVVFSSIGYESRELIIGNNRNLVVHLQAEASALDEMVVKGYYAVSRRLNTGSVTEVKAEAIANQPVSNPLAAMQGRMPGVYITQNTGVAGGAFSIQIRGKNSIKSGNDPLYLVDGLPFTSTLLGSSFASITQRGSPLASINPSDIESIEVLKDADATAIYGSRGANGVVLITTKKGKTGKTKISVNFYSGIGKAADRMKLLNTQQYLQMRREAYNNDGIVPVSSDPDATDLLIWDTTRFTDWQKALIGGTAGIQNAEVSISGGNANTQFLAAGTYHRESNVFPGSFADKKAAFHFNISNTSNNQKFKSLVSGMYSSDNNHLLNTDPTRAALTLPPDTPPVYDSSGKLNWGNNFNNPYGPLLTKYNMGVDNVLGNMVLNYELLPGLVLKFSTGYTKILGKELNTYPLSSLNPAFGSISGLSFFGNSSSETWIAEPQLEYQTKLKSGKLSILAGSTLQQDIKQASLLLATGFLDDALTSNPAAASSVTIANFSPDDNYYRKYKYEALFARINYNLKDRYILNITGRRDGSSRFGPGRQFANFGAGGAAWIFSQESFVQKHLSFLNFGKLRASYGVTGNDQIEDYGYLSTYTSSDYPYNGSPGLYPARLFNSDYAWERNKKIEAALELGFFKNKLLFTLAYFHNRSSNQLVGLPLPLITGFGSIQANLPAIVQNDGWELSVSSVNYNTEKFHWNTTFNFTLPANKLVSYPDINGSGFRNTYAVGKPLNIVYKIHEQGVSSTTGLYTFQDLDKSNSISYPDDAQFIKTISQKFYGGIENDLGFKSWQLNFLFQFVKQTGYNYKTGFAAPGLSYVNQPAWVLARWQKPGDQTEVQKFTAVTGSDAYNAYSTNQYDGDGTISDASFVRLRNLSLSYSLPSKRIKPLHMESCKLVLLAQNLLTFTNYLGLDPETQSSSSLPPLKIVTLGFQLTF